VYEMFFVQGFSVILPIIQKMAALLVDYKNPFKPVYSVYHHEYLGHLISAHVVALSTKGAFTLTHQRLLPDNAAEFSGGMDETDQKLVQLLYDITPQVIVKKNARGETIKASEFFRNKFKGAFRDLILDNIQKKLNEALKILASSGKELYIMTGNGNPAGSKINLHQEKAQVTFHFNRNKDDINYFPTLTFQGRQLDFPPNPLSNQAKETKILCSEPAWILLEKDVFRLDGDVDGKKLDPFLSRKFISIPLTIESEFHSRFIESLLKNDFQIESSGFDIETIETSPHFVLGIREEPNDILTLKPEIQYGSFRYPFVAAQNPYHVIKTKNAEGLISYQRIVRDLGAEDSIRQYLLSLPGINNFSMEYSFKRDDAFDWLMEHAEMIREKGFEIVQDGSGELINFDKPQLILETKSSGDYFDIHAIVRIGKYEIPFMKFRRNILQNIRHYKLPDGSQVLLPGEWFTDYRHLLEVAEKEEEHLRIRKYQAGLLAQLPSFNKDDFKKLADFESIQAVEKPRGLTADLRPYQQSGFEWLCFLNEYGCGGILADDMGLGKTLQALCFILHLVEKGQGSPILVVMPTSLLYNWHQEALKFSPHLKILVYRGLQREKEIENFPKYDVIITSYGVARNDETSLRHFPFSCMILDESQIIKNSQSKTAQALRNYLVRKRISLTGTPIENSTMDLWSQMNFLNPGLLGGETFFRNYYANPIDKEQDMKKAEKLKSLIKPFILRRTKEQVATELPPKIEQVHYCEMPEEQASCYEEEKSRYRNVYLKELSELGEAKSKFNLLAGLQKLRQIALHPGITGYPDVPSGKLEEIHRMTAEIVEKGSKVLIFSQFVKMLDVLRKEFDGKGIQYAYIDGAVKDRMAEVDKFQKQEETQVFLISLKAGGTGLTLTAAEYVFILDPWWNPAVERQATDRAHRIGQDKTVFIYRFISLNTIEEKILKLQEKKARIASDIIQVEEEFFKSLSEDDIRQLLD
jgi:SNF2 family DNA or RNA helicase